MNSSMYGISQKINEMIDNRIFGEDTIDAVLQDTSIKLDNNSYKKLYKNTDFASLIENEKIKKKRKVLCMLSNMITSDSKNDYDKVKDILSFVSNISENYPLKEQNNEKTYKTPKDYFWGGTEEILIFKGSDWCSEIARVFCALCQCENIPARIVYTFSDLDGHIINEVWIENNWLLVDSTNGFIYKDKQGEFLSLLNLVFDKEYRISKLIDYDKYYYSNPCYFEHVFLNYYWISKYDSYNYALSFCNQYYEEVLADVWNQSEEGEENEFETMGNIEFV